MFDKQYFRLFLTVAVIGVAAAAQQIATMELGYEKMSPVYSTDGSLSVSSGGEAGEMTVGYSNPGKLGVGLPDESAGGQAQAEAGQAHVQDSAAMDSAAPSHANENSAVVNGQNGIPTTATTRVDVPQAELKAYMNKATTLAAPASSSLSL